MSSSFLASKVLLDAPRRIWLLQFAALLIVAGRLGGMIGPRRPLVPALALFAVASALFGAAQRGWVAGGDVPPQDIGGEVGVLVAGGDVKGEPEAARPGPIL